MWKGLWEMELGQASWAGGCLELPVDSGSRQTSGGQGCGQHLFLALDFRAHFSHPHTFPPMISSCSNCRQHLTFPEVLTYLPI